MSSDHASASGGFDAAAYKRELQHGLEQETNEHRGRLEAQLAEERVLRGFGLTHADVHACVGKYLKGHVSGMDRGPRDAKWATLNVFPPLSEETMQFLTQKIEAAAREYGKPEQNPTLPRLHEITQVVAETVRFEQKTDDGNPAHTQLKIFQRLPKDFLNTIQDILKEKDIQIDQHIRGLLDISRQETLKGPYNLALRPGGTLKAFVVRDGQIINEIPLCENDEHARPSEIYKVQAGAEGHQNKWTPAKQTESDDARTDAPLFHVGRHAHNVQGETWVQFQLVETPGTRPTETGFSAHEPRVLYWNVQTTSDKQTLEVVQNYGAYFSAVFEPVHPYPVRPIPPPPPPEPPKARAMAIGMAYPDDTQAPDVDQEAPPSPPLPPAPPARAQVRYRYQ